MRTSNYRPRNADDVPYFNIRHNLFKYSFFPSPVIEWNKLVSRLRKVKSFTDFKKKLTASLKLVSAIFYQFFIFSPNDNPPKTMKNVFYFI